MRPPVKNPFLITRDDPHAMLHRVAEFDRAAINERERTVEIAFSSEAPVDRWFGTEVLGHEPGNVRLGRLNNGGAVLMEHDRRDQVGVVVKASVDKDRKGRATIRFGKSARAEEIFQDVKDGIRRLVSVGYRIHKQETENKPGGVETVRVTDWEPYELSLVSIPADDSVGVGRGETTVPATPNTFSQSTSMNREQILARLRALNIAFDESATTEALRALLPEAERNAAPVTTPAPAAPVAQRSADPVPAPVPQLQVVREDPAVIAQRAVEVERTRMSTITAIASQARNQGIEVDAARAIADGISADAFRTQVFDALVSRQTSYQPGTPSRSEQRDLSQFSFARGIQALVDGGRLTGIEAEMHQEAQREASASGLALRGGFSVPQVMLNYGRRDQTAGTAADGGNTIQNTFGSFIELLYAKMVLRQLGAQFLTGLVGNLPMPKMLTGSAPVKKAENAAADESSPTYGQVTLTPKRLPTFIEVSKQLLRQSAVGIEGILRNDLATALGLGMEYGAIHGGGTNEPTGIVATAGIGSVAGGTNGLAPTWAHIVALETAVATANADIGSLGYLTNPKVRGKLKGTSKAGTEAIMVWGEGDTPLNGYRAPVTTQVSSTLTKGTSSGVCSAILFGNFADLVIGQWGGIDIQVNPYIKDTEGLVRITADVYYDAAVRRAGSFAAMLDALTV
jgi:HK97 family phage major capsid protein/HK97 family phage prohead protease